MSRDKIKVIEFGMDDDRRSLPKSTAHGAMKIIEFDNEPDDGGKRVATARDVRDIKIIEFDGDPEVRKSPVPQKTGRRVGPVKIKEFAEDGEDRKTIGGTPNIKILEFD